MPVFLRRSTPPPAVNDYTKYRPVVREDFRECCAYCLLHEIIAGGETNFELDPFRPKSRPEFAGLINDFYNIYYACHVCNQCKSRSWPAAKLSKQGYCFVDFCKDDFSVHFREERNGAWTPLTKPAAYTEARLRLNRKHLVEIRFILRQMAMLRGVAPIDWNTPKRETIFHILDMR